MNKFWLSEKLYAQARCKTFFLELCEVGMQPNEKTKLNQT